MNLEECKIKYSNWSHEECCKFIESLKRIDISRQEKDKWIKKTTKDFIKDVKSKKLNAGSIYFFTLYGKRPDGKQVIKDNMYCKFYKDKDKIIIISSKMDKMIVV